MTRLRATINILGGLLVAFVLTTCIVAAFACASGGAPRDLTLPPSKYVQRFRAVYLVNNHLEWWLNPFARTDDSETYPKIVVISDLGQACVLTPDDRGYGEWASALRDNPINCPRPWRFARRQ